MSGKIATQYLQKSEIAFLHLLCFSLLKIYTYAYGQPPNKLSYAYEGEIRVNHAA